MTKLALLGAAVIVMTYTSSPATAQHRAAPAVNPYTAGDWCPGREPGNPYFNCVSPRIRYHAYGF